MTRLDRFFLFAPLLPILLLIFSCSHSVPFKLSDRQGEPLPSAAIRSPAAGEGSSVLWGGMITEVKFFPNDVTELTILQSSLNPDKTPDLNTTYGQFMAWIPTLLDPALYQNGSQVTLAGEVVGEQTQPMGPIQYTYPLVFVKGIRLWDQRGPLPYAGVDWGKYSYYVWPFSQRDAWDSLHNMAENENPNVGP